MLHAQKMSQKTRIFWSYYWFLAASSKPGSRLWPVIIVFIVVTVSWYKICVQTLWLCENDLNVWNKYDDRFYFILCRHSSFSVTSGISEKGPQGRENHKETNFVGLLLLISFAFFSSLSVALLRDAPLGFFFCSRFTRESIYSINTVGYKQYVQHWRPKNSINTMLTTLYVAKPCSQGN